ncbi:MAG: ribbon-helix-helix protein, CopG family [Acidimicrobiales bacterium]
MTRSNSYGRTRGGEVVTDEVADRWAAEAETEEYHDLVNEVVERRPGRVVTDPAGLDRLRRGGRPRLGAGQSVQVRIRLAPESAAALDAAVERSGRRRSEIVRDALLAYLGAG